MQEVRDFGRLTHPKPSYPHHDTISPKVWLSTMATSRLCRRIFPAVASSAVVGGSTVYYNWNYEKDLEDTSTSTSKFGSQLNRLLLLLPLPPSTSWISFLFVPTANIFTGTTTITLCEGKKEDSYPNFSRFGQHSYLAKYLTPEIYRQLKDKKTKSNGVTLEDMIQSGVSLPWGARPPNGMGVFAGDEECYTVFAPLLIPMIQDFHGISNRLSQPKKEGEKLVPRRLSKLRRQVTNLNPEYVLSQNPDPTGEYILYTRMRASRCLSGYPFSPVISRGERRQVEKILVKCLEDFNKADFFAGTYTSVMDMTNVQHGDFKQRHLIFQDPTEYTVAAGLGRDWPDARGLYVNNPEKPELLIWCNAEDHFRIVAMKKGGNVLEMFTRLSQALTNLESSLEKQGHKFAQDPNLGFLNCSPKNLGTALRASVFVKLVRLGQEPGFEELLERLRLESSARFKEQDTGRYTGIFDIANSERLGQSEVQVINTMINGVGRLIALEKKLEKGEKVNLDEIRI
jgi:creatine kinase